MTQVAPLRPDDPERLGPYELRGRLGEGGMGTVYLGVDTRAGRMAGPVAVKVIHPRHGRDARFRARFLREVQAARRVARFCTAPVLDADVDTDMPYVVTEYIQGRSLQAAVDAAGPLTASALEAVAVSVASALVAIHAAGVVHRDLKPGNVLLSEVGPRVIDFGIAGAVDFTPGLTSTGLMLGTPAFMAPEQFGDRGQVTAAADVFAWGCLITYAGVGRTPFAADNLMGLAYQIVHGAPDLEGLGVGLRGLVERSLAKDPAARPSARELLAHLLGAPADHPAPAAAAPPTQVKQAPPVVGTARNRTPVMPSPAPGGHLALPTGRHSEQPAVRPDRALASPPAGRHRAVTALAVLMLCALAYTRAVFWLNLPAPASVLAFLWARGREGQQAHSTSTAAPSTAAIVTEGNSPGPTAQRARADAVPAFARLAWAQTGRDTECLPLVPTQLGEGQGARPRPDEGSDSSLWSIVYDLPRGPGRNQDGTPCPDCGKGAFGIADTPNPAGDGLAPGWPMKRVWPDGTIAWYGPAEIRPGQGPHYRAVVQVPGQRCEYKVWTFRGRDHLEVLLDGLRLAPASL